jgi:hypothetical protein
VRGHAPAALHVPETGQLGGQYCRGIHIYIARIDMITNRAVCVCFIARRGSSDTWCLLWASRGCSNSSSG